MRALAVVVTTLMALGWWQPSAAYADPGTCSGVWVVVGEELSCATKFATGEQALMATGSTVVKKNSMICQIDGHPDKCSVGFDAYWSYWQSNRQSDGSYAPWVYATVGAASYQPEAGDADGWAFGAGEPPSKLPPPDSYQPGDPQPGVTHVTSSSPVPTAVTLAIMVVGSAALTGAHRKRSPR